MNLRRPSVLVVVFVAWTAFVWSTRIRNLLGDDDASTPTKVWGTTTSLVLLGLAAAVLVALLTRRAWFRPALRLLGGLTVVVWLVRGADIVVDDHGLGFTVVHLVLAVISIALAVATWPRRSATA